MVLFDLTSLPLSIDEAVNLAPTVELHRALSTSDGVNKSPSALNSYKHFPLFTLKKKKAALILQRSNKVVNMHKQVCDVKKKENAQIFGDTTKYNNGKSAAFKSKLESTFIH